MRSTIIVIERDDLIRATLLELLGAEGYAAHGAKDSAEADRVVQGIAAPCLILADLVSLGADPTQYLRAHRHAHALLQVPVAVMSSIGILPAQGKALQNQGASSYLEKPFDIEEFLQVVRQYCRQA